MNSDYGVPTAPVKTTQRNYFQFSTRAILTIGSIIAMVIGCIAAPAFFAIAACVLYLATTCLLLTTLIYGRGWIKGFAIGFSIPHVLGYVIALASFARPEGVLILFLFSMLASTTAGFATAIARGYLKSCEGKVAIPPVPALRRWLSND